jgi:hypothetical protein
MSANLSVVLAVLPAVVVGLLLPLAIVGLVAYGVAELVRAGSDRSTDGEAGPVETGTSSVPVVVPTTSPAVTILDERFARGEIDTEDYVQRRELLLASVGGAVPRSEGGPDPTPTELSDAAPTATVDVATATVDATTAADEDAADEDASDAVASSPGEEQTGELPSADQQPPPAD